jgi:hypothetical protein
MSFDDGRLLTERVDATRLIQILRVLGPRYLEGEPLQTLIDLLATTDQLRDDRNFIVHGTWMVIQPEGHATSSSIRTKSEPGQVVAEHFPHSRMRAIIKSMIQTREALVPIIRSVPWSSDDKSE